MHMHTPGFGAVRSFQYLGLPFGHSAPAITPQLLSCGVMEGEHCDQTAVD